MTTPTFTVSYAKRLLTAMGVFTFGCLTAGLALEAYWLFLFPPAVLVGYFAVFDFKQLFWLMLLTLPLTKKFYPVSGYSLDLPAEPLVILLLVVLGFYAGLNRNIFEPGLFRHPIVQVQLLHVLWILVAVLFAAKFFIGFKFLLAKLWYVGTFFFVTALLVRELEDFKKLFWLAYIPLCATVLWFLVQHAGYGFSFDDVNAAVQPFYKNHVNFAAFLTLFLPFVWIAARWYKPRSWSWYAVMAGRVLLLAGIYLSYTRGAWLAVFAALIFWWALRGRWVTWLMTAVVVLFGLFAYHMAHEKQYLRYAPEYKKAVYHANLGDHLEATVQIQDVSTAERFFRWVGGVRMSTEYPVTGYGPNNFYHYYKRHTVTAFTTYVSENRERSGVHNYFLMTVIEQGFVGLALFLLLSLLILYRGVRLFHRLTDAASKRLVAAILCSFVIIYVQLMLSDLIEALKIGSFFFINMAVLVNLDLRSKKAQDMTRAKH